jgi:predicted RNA-binding Zn-ribbon protein involved in translation (DUF1610 family)
MKLKTCPKCGSREIGMDMLMGVTGTVYKCDNCGYSGDIIMEQDIDKNMKE